MRENIEIRASRAGDRPLLEALYPAAFPDEDLLPVLRALLGDTSVLSLVATVDGEVVGHIAFTACRMGDRPEAAALLAPLAVAPAAQRQGTGAALIQEGLRRLSAAGCAQVFVLGDPAYYGRLGFAPERRVTPPYPLPEKWRDAWQSLALNAAEPAPTGALIVPAYWQKPELWS